MLRSSLVLALLFAPSNDVLAPVGNVLRVGPTRPHTTIGDAVSAAFAGDLILVDAGSYPPFVIDGKGLSIVADTTGFSVLEAAGATPAILVQNIVFPEQVTIVGVSIDHGPAVDAPAIHIRNSTGAVKLAEVVVTQTADLFGTVAHGAIQVEATNPVWLTDVKVRRLAGPFVAYRQGSSGWAEAVNGLYLLDSNAVLKGCRLRGYDAGLAHAGDGLRLEGNSTAWLIDNILNSPTGSSYEGGKGDYGGSALQAFGRPWADGRVTSCGPVKFVAGKGVTQPGGFYSINGDASLVSSGTYETKRRPDGCSIYTSSECTIAPRATIGGTLQVNLLSISPQIYFCVASLNTRYSRVLYGLKGRGVIDITPSVTYVIASGQLQGGVALRIRIPIPNQPALAGMQLSFQSMTGTISSGQYTALSMPSFSVLVN